MEKTLILSAKNGDKAALSELFRMYSPLIDSLISRYGSHPGDSVGVERDDLRQEACMGFYRALVAFDTEQDKVSFGLFAKICIRNRLVSIYRSKKSRDKRIPKSGLPVEEAAETGARGTDSAGLMAMVEEKLSGYEKRVFLLYLGGASYAEMALKVGKSEKSVDNALFRARKKLKNGLGV